MTNAGWVVVVLVLLDVAVLVHGVVRLPIHAHATGYFYTTIYVGNSPVNVVVDTSVNELVLACGAEGQHLPISSQSRNITCMDTELCPNPSMCPSSTSPEACAYLANAYVFRLVRGSVCLVNPSKGQHAHCGLLAVGCSTQFPGALDTKGILGLAPSTGFSGRTGLDRLLHQGMVTSTSFRFCLNDETGFLRLDESPSMERTESWIPFAQSEERVPYALALESFSLGDSHDNVKLRGVVAQLNTGTQFSWLPRRLFRELRGKLQRHCSQSGHCARGTSRVVDDKSLACFGFSGDPTREESLVEGFPVLVFAVKAGKDVDGAASKVVQFHIPPRQYLYQSTLTEDNVFCVGMFADDGIDHVVLGINALRDYDISVDGEHQQVQVLKGCDAHASTSVTIVHETDSRSSSPTAPGGDHIATHPVPGPPKSSNLRKDDGQGGDSPALFELGVFLSLVGVGAFVLCCFIVVQQHAPKFRYKMLPERGEELDDDDDEGDYDEADDADDEGGGYSSDASGDQG